MAIGDMIFQMLGRSNPRDQIAQAMSQSQMMPQDMNAPQPGVLPNMSQGGMGPDQQNQPPPSPQPQAYQSPPDMTKLYLQLMDRAQANASIDRGMGLIAGAFSHNQADRDLMVNTMNQPAGGGGVGDLGSQMTGLMNLQKMQIERQMMMAQMQHLPAIAKELGISQDMAYGLWSGGKLGDVMQNITQSKYQQGTPQYQAELKKTLADAGLTAAQTGAVPSTIAKTQADTALAQAQTAAVPSTIAKTQAETAAIPADVALKQAQTAQAMSQIPKNQADVANIQAQTAKTQQDLKYPTDASKNYAFYANNELEGKRQPVSFGDWIASGGQNPTEQMKDYRLAMSQIPEGQPKPSFNEWTANIAGMKEAYTQSALLQTQQKMNAQNQLPDVTQKITEQLGLIDSALKDSALNDITGANVKRALTYVPGTPQRNLDAKLDQIAGATGVSAVESLKGVGRILGTEYTAGTEAQSRLHDRSQSTDAYRTALQDYRNKIAGQLRIVYDRAGMPVPAELDAQLKGPVAPVPGTKNVVRDKNGNLVIQ